MLVLGLEPMEVKKKQEKAKLVYLIKYVVGVKF